MILLAVSRNGVKAYKKNRAQAATSLAVHSQGIVELPPCVAQDIWEINATRLSLIHPGVFAANE
jgi:hypothetical protein